MASSPTMDDYITNVTSDAPAYEQEHRLELLIPLTLLYVIIFTCGIIGNGTVCVVIHKNIQMHTATYYHVLSLAISYITVLLCGLPFEIYRLWSKHYPLSGLFCLATGLATETAANATVLTITLFTVERFNSICKPFLCDTISNLLRAFIVIVIWITSLITAMPFAVKYGIETYVENGRNTAACTVRIGDYHQMFLTYSILFFIIPMITITVLYVVICIKFRTSAVLHPDKNLSIVSFDQATQAHYRIAKSQAKIIRMQRAVAVSFFICWAPFHAQRLFSVYGRDLQLPSDTYYMVYVILTYISRILYFLSAAINPVLYSIMSNQYRAAFNRTLAVCCEEPPPRRRPHGYYSGLFPRHVVVNTRADDRARARRLHGFTAAEIHDSPPTTQRYDVDGRNVFDASDNRRGYKSRGSNDYFDTLEVQPKTNTILRDIELELALIELSTFIHNTGSRNEGLT